MPVESGGASSPPAPFRPCRRALDRRSARHQRAHRRLSARDLALVYDPSADLILSFGVESSVDAAVAAAFERIQNPRAAGPASLACDPSVIDAVRLKSARFLPPPTAVTAVNAELPAANGLFEDFLARGAPAEQLPLPALADGRFQLGAGPRGSSRPTI